MSNLLLTADDFTKSPSSRWPRRCLSQWIESMFGYDDEACDEAYGLIFRFIENRRSTTSEPTCYSISAWAEQPDVTYEDLAAAWNSMARELISTYGDRVLSIRQGDSCHQY